MSGCQTCGGYGMKHDPVAHGTEGVDPVTPRPMTRADAIRWRCRRCDWYTTQFIHDDPERTSRPASAYQQELEAHVRAIHPDADPIETGIEAARLIRQAMQ